MTTLEDLKRAIDSVPSHPGPCIPGQNVDQWLALVHEHRRWEADAWRTFAQFLMRLCSTYGSEYPEFMEAVKLVEERLK